MRIGRTMLSTRLCVLQVGCKDYLLVFGVNLLCTADILVAYLVSTFFPTLLNIFINFLSSALPSLMLWTLLVMTAVTAEGFPILTLALQRFSLLARVARMNLCRLEWTISRQEYP